MKPAAPNLYNLVIFNGTVWRGFKSRQHEVVFGTVFSQNKTILCKHDII